MPPSAQGQVKEHVKVASFSLLICRVTINWLNAILQLEEVS